MSWRASDKYETKGWYLHPFIPFTICKLPDRTFGVYTEECQLGNSLTAALPTLKDACDWAENKYVERNKRNG